MLSFRRKIARTARPSLIESLETRRLFSAKTLTVTSSSAEGTGSLNVAIDTANADTANTYTINFDIPGNGTHTINYVLGDAVHSLTNQIWINGASQPGYAGKPLIVLSLGSTSKDAAFFVNASNCRISALSIVNFGDGIDVDSDSFTVDRCYIGELPNGTAAGNQGYGILVQSDDDQIGLVGKGNVIGGNGWDGIATEGADDTDIVANLIGTNPAGNAAVPNGTMAKGNSLFENGILLQSVDNNVGGDTLGEGNLIAGNVGTGIDLNNGFDNIIGNKIGCNASGSAALGNNGITVGGDGNDLQIGDDTKYGGNQVVGGITIAGTSANRIEDPEITGNLIGTDSTGKHALGSGGFTLSFVDFAQLDGAVIAGGLFLKHSTGDSIQGDYIGVAKDGTSALGGSGIQVLDGDDSDINIGGNSVIAFSKTGVYVQNVSGKQSTGIDVMNASIYSNHSSTTYSHGAGIVLQNYVDGSGHGASGPNLDQNPPTLTSATSSSSQTTITGTFHSLASKTFTIELFSNPSLDSDGKAEGRNYLGKFSVTTNSSGSATFSHAVTAVTAGQYITATAADPSSNSSEFSYAVKVAAPTVFSGTVFNDANKNGKKDSGEAGLAGWEVYDDANNNGKLDSGETLSFTTSSGSYGLGILGTGTAHIREIIPSNWSQTTPSNNGAINITLAAGSSHSNENFGNHTSIKYLSTVATTSGIVGWWTFDSASQANSILNGYTGTLKGGATISNSAGAPIQGESSSSGLSLNGTSAFVNTNLINQQQFATAATVNAWIDLGSTPAQSGHFYDIATKSAFANDLDLQVELDGTIHFYTDSGTSTSFKPTSLTGWHMVTAEFDTTAKIRKIFWDGKLVATTSPYTGTHSASTGTFAIGESDVFTARFFDGKIDEVSLFNDALSSSQISAIYTAAKGS